MKFTEFKIINEAQFNSKQEVIDHFVKQGKSAAAGASAWERGWRGHTPKKKELKPPPRSYHDDLDDKRYSETNEEQGVAEGSYNPATDLPPHHPQSAENVAKRKAAEKQKKKQQQGVAEDWQKANKSDKTDGMSPKAVKAYRRENPGSKLQTAVTTKPSKLKAGSKDAKRRKSFCARMSGNKGPMKDEKGRPTPKAKALSRWNCESIEEIEQALEEAKKDPCWKGYKQIGMKKKGGKQVPNCVPTNEEQVVAETSDKKKQEYKTAAEQQVKELEPHAKKGEYKDIAQRMIDRRKKGLKRVKESVEDLEAMLEAAIGTAPKRPARSGSRPARGHAPVERYKKHISPSGVETTMPPTDDDYAINYGKNGLVAKDRTARGVDVATGTHKEELEEHKKGYRAKKYPRKPINSIGPRKPKRGKHFESVEELEARLEEARIEMEGLVCEFCGSHDHTALDESGKASRSLCVSSKPDSELGASQLASCKSQGLRARDGEKSHKIGKTRTRVGGHKIRGKKYGGPLPDWS